MTGEEVKTAFLEKWPVVYRDITYQNISALVYRRRDDCRVLLQVELMDKNNNSVTIAAAEKVSPLV